MPQSRFHKITIQVPEHTVPPVPSVNAHTIAARRRLHKSCAGIRDFPCMIVGLAPNVPPDATKLSEKADAIYLYQGVP